MTQPEIYKMLLDEKQKRKKENNLGRNLFYYGLGLPIIILVTMFTGYQFHLWEFILAWFICAFIHDNIQ